MIYSQLAAEEVNSFHKFIHLLRKLKVIGIYKTTTEQIRLTEMGKPHRYKLRFDSYDPTTKGKLTNTEDLELFFSYVHELGFDDDSDSEPLGSCRPSD